MEVMTDSNVVPGIRPRVVAEDFGVNLRTVFRWIRRGWLESVNGRVKDDYKTTFLSDWSRSCSFREAKKKLKVSIGTLSAWKKKGLLETVAVMGFERVSISSVEKIIQRRRAGTFSLHPLYGMPNRLLKITGVGHKTLKACLDEGIVPSVTVDGKRMILNKDIEKIVVDWNRSCRPSAAGRIVSKNKSTIVRWLANGRLIPITVLGQARIVLSSVAETPEEKEHFRAYRSLERKKFRRRKNYRVPGYRKHKKLNIVEKRKQLKVPKKLNKFLCKRMDGYQLPKRPAAVPDYKPKQVKVKGFGAKRLTTCEEAAMATGRARSYIEDLYRAGAVRGEMMNDQIFVYILSLETLVAKLRRGAIY